MRTSRVLVPAIAAAALLAVLSACSADDTSKASGTPRPTASASPEPVVLPDAEVRVPDAKATAECVDGAAVIDQSGTEVTLEGACAKVTVSANDSVVHLGDVGELVVESAISRITVGTAERVTINGNANDVLYSGEKPSKLTDHGEQNVVQAQEAE